MYVDEKKHGEVVVDAVGQAMLDAAKYIEKQGWCQYTIRDKKDRVCLIGAFHALGTLIVWPEVARKMGFSFAHDPVIWNNAPGRTAEEVIARLRQFA